MEGGSHRRRRVPRRRSRVRAPPPRPPPRRQTKKPYPALRRPRRTFPRRTGRGFAISAPHPPRRTPNRSLISPSPRALSSRSSQPATVRVPWSEPDKVYDVRYHTRDTRRALEGAARPSVTTGDGGRRRRGHRAEWRCSPRGQHGSQDPGAARSAYVMRSTSTTPTEGTPDETERLWKEVCDGDSRRDRVLNAWRGAREMRRVSKRRARHRRHCRPKSCTNCRPRRACCGPERYERAARKG